MTFDNVINDVKKLIGIKLCSIRPGAEITLLSVDEDQGSLTLKMASGKVRSRPISELKIIWEQMSRLPVVHVDEALHGSGTSRNQPETILANLPYVEWLNVDKKKNIAFVNENTHPFGTLKEMDAMKAEILISSFSKKEDTEKTKGLIVTNDISTDIELLLDRFSDNTETLDNGVYLYSSGTNSIIVATERINLPLGCYLILHTGYLPNSGKQVTIANQKYELLSLGSTKVLITAN